MPGRQGTRHTPGHEFARNFRRLKLDAKTHLVSDAGRPDRLSRNDGPDSADQTRFSDVSEASGVNASGFGASATWWDYDGDGWMDLSVANDFDYADRLHHIHAHPEHQLRGPAGSAVLPH